MEYAKQFLDKRTDSFENKDPYLFCVWGHSYEFNDSNSWDVIENLAKFISGKDDVWYATNAEIFDYCDCFKKLIFNAERTLVFNPTHIDVFFEHIGKRFVVKSG